MSPPRVSRSSTTPSAGCSGEITSSSRWPSARRPRLLPGRRCERRPLRVSPLRSTRRRRAELWGLRGHRRSPRKQARPAGASAPRRLRAISDTERNLLLFDGLEAMAARWGAGVAARFFARCCPQLLERGAIAYWSMPVSEDYVALRRTVEEITQCVFVLDQKRLRVAKAEGRPPGVEGSVFRCSEADDLPVLAPAPIAARVGTALHAARLERSLSQSDLARLAGVSPSGSPRPSADSAASPSRPCSSCPHSSM